MTPLRVSDNPVCLSILLQDKVYNVPSMRGSDVFLCKGSHHKKVLLVSAMNLDPEREKTAVFLEKVLAAVGFSPDDCAMIDQGPFHDDVILRTAKIWQSEMVITFGHTLGRPMEKIPLLAFPALADIMESKPLKAQLWAELKKAFGMNASE